MLFVEESEVVSQLIYKGSEYFIFVVQFSLHDLDCAVSLCVTWQLFGCVVLEEGPADRDNEFWGTQFHDLEDPGLGTPWCSKKCFMDCLLSFVSRSLVDQFLHAFIACCL